MCLGGGYIPPSFGNGGRIYVSKYSLLGEKKNGRMKLAQEDVIVGENVHKKWGMLVADRYRCAAAALI